MNGLKRLAVVVVGAMVLSALAIQASDTLRGLDTNLSAVVGGSTGPCAVTEKLILMGDRALCVDMYEASPGTACPHAVSSSQIETQDNINEISCTSVTQSGATPWRFVSLTQAQQICARSGKRLPTNDEWYKFASGLADQSKCVTDRNSGPLSTGVAGCITPAGIHDVVGNVWEWIDAQVINGIFDSRSLPASGYVSLVDTSGIVIETALNAQIEFGEDYAWTNSNGVYGIIRGGFYGSESDAGIFTQNLATPLDTKTAGVGFRCVRDI